MHHSVPAFSVRFIASRLLQKANIKSKLHARKFFICIPVVAAVVVVGGECLSESRVLINFMLLLACCLLLAHGTKWSSNIIRFMLAIIIMHKRNYYIDMPFLMIFRNPHTKQQASKSRSESIDERRRSVGCGKS